MISIDDKELFEKYYQSEYDFNTTSLSEDEIDEIKELVKQIRVNYALAPMGTHIFTWIQEQNPNIHFELVDFESDKIDGMLYIPESGSERAYIILNSNKNLLNQIFTTTHEYYHYIKDYSKIKEKPYVCCFNELKSVNEKRASRFAAEFLLPEEALKNEMKIFRKQFKMIGQNELSHPEYAAISLCLTIKYQMPLKAVIYRLYEEKYIDNIDFYIDNYAFLKNFLQEVKIEPEKIEHLYSNDNPYLLENRMVYRQMKNAYATGYATRDEIIEDARLLALDEEMILDFFDIIEDDDEDDDMEMLAFLSDIMEDK